MEPACTPWIRSLTAGVVLAALAGCSALAPPPSPAPLLHDALFDHPARPAEADAAMAVDDAMRHYVRGVLAGAARDRGRPRALADALYAPGQLKLEYDAAVTRTAAQAFAARSGNCLSLVLMTAALAREMGLDVVFQSSRWVETYSRSGDLTFYNGHVNLVLARAALPAYRDAGHHTRAADALQIDFLPPEALGGLRSVPISEQRVRAMFMNNRAVETLTAGPLATAYAWVRESLRHDPGFWPAYNTLGVVYQRAGHLAQAAAALEHALAHDPSAVPAMANQAQVLRSLGRHDEAAVWNARRAALEPNAPFHFLRQAEVALAQGEVDRAEALLDREQAVTGRTHDLHFLRARLHLARGERARAAQALREAAAASDSPGQQQAYAAKLERLRAAGTP